MRDDPARDDPARGEMARRVEDWAGTGHLSLQVTKSMPRLVPVVSGSIVNFKPEIRFGLNDAGFAHSIMANFPPSSVV
jgi:hypothetical protein